MEESIYNESNLSDDEDDYKETEEIDDSSGINGREPFDPSKIDIEVKTLSIDLLVKRLKNNRIELQTEFQRKGNLWTIDQQSRLIESLMIRIPLPAFYFDGSEGDKWLIVDGLQRLTTLKNFIVLENFSLSGLEYMTQYEGMKFSEIPLFLQSRIEEGQITAYVIKPGTPFELKFNIFKRINTGGLVLTSQEIRHALHSGAVADFVKNLAESKEFIHAMGAAYKYIKTDRMEDREYVNRFIAYYLLIDHYKPDLETFLNTGLLELRKKNHRELEELKENFIGSMLLSSHIFGRYNFRRIEMKDERRKPINKALFETISVNFAWLTAENRNKLKKRKADFFNAFIGINNEPEFKSSITTGTGSKQSVNLRFNRVKKIIQDIL